MNDLTRFHYRTLALAGVIQAVVQVDRIARSGQSDAAAFNAVIHSLFSFDPESPLAVFGSIYNLRPGLQALERILSGDGRAEYQQAIRYAMGVLHLQKKLAADPAMQATIRSRLQHTEKKLEHFTQDINEIASSVAAVYQDTISHLKFRIQVIGSHQQLQDPNNADKIRALLLAAIRSAVLWRQLGGHRYQLLLGRAALLQATRELLQH
jgi:high frequency lysogenization protein